MKNLKFVHSQDIQLCHNGRQLEDLCTTSWYLVAILLFLICIFVGI